MIKTIRGLLCNVKKRWFVFSSIQYMMQDAANAAQNMRLLAATKHFKIEASYHSQQQPRWCGGCSYNDARPFVCVQRDSDQTTFHLYRIIHPGRTCELLSLHSLHSAHHIVEAYFSKNQTKWKHI